MIDQAFGWLGKVAEFCGSLIPRLVIVKTSERCVKYRQGRNLTILDPGLHVYWPLVTELEWCSVVRQVLVHHPHVITTQDRRRVVVGGVTAYRVSNPVRYLAENEDPEKTIDDVVAAAIRRVVAGISYHDLCELPDETDRALTDAARRLLRPFGVRAEYTRLTDFAETRTIHLTGGTPVPTKNDG